ncbi:MAG: copper amine oxidase [Deltaproteobacteria bacterium RBG_13_65_10]|nr:MAG: copper amine oxidase [Deltaproteobacteria bacterium RBG_13_65_10]
MTIYKSPTCGCCAMWIDTLRAQGFRTVVHDDEAMDVIKDRLGVPRALHSCHTAEIENYVVEGHVPAEDLSRLLSERPEVTGLAAPGMPRSSPGMAVPGAPVEPYEVVAFRRDGWTQLYARH